VSNIPTWMRQKYEQYINSPQWKQTRADALKRAGYKCQVCGAPQASKSLEVHHVTYDRLGTELPTDLRVLCKDCHKKADQERELQGQYRGQMALYRARMDGWARKVFGDNWQDWQDYDYVRDRFESWLERRGEQ